MVRVEGPSYGDTRYNWYRVADAFAITPTLAEETSLASLEALSVGTPLISTERSEIPGWRQLRPDMVFPADDLEKGAQAIATFFRKSRSERQSDRPAISRFAMEHFSVQAVARKLEHVLATAALSVRERH